MHMVIVIRSTIRIRLYIELIVESIINVVAGINKTSEEKEQLVLLVVLRRNQDKCR